MSVHTEPIEPKITPSHNVDRCRDILSGFKHQDLPDLSARRFPPGVVRTAVSSLTLPDTTANTASHDVWPLFAPVIGTVARIFGAYCGCNDVLLAVADFDKTLLRPIRVTWDDQLPWTGLLTNVSEALRSDISSPVLLHDLQNILSLGKKQSPCMAIFRISSSSKADQIDLDPNIPIVFTINTSNSSLSLTATDSVFHSDVSELFLSQVTALQTHVSNNPSLPVAQFPEFPPNVMSVYEKLPMEERKAYFHRLPHTRMATDHLTLHATSQPDDIALRWYPDLNRDQPISSLEVHTLTFAEWHHKANQVARWLLQKGLQREDRVAVCMQRDTWFHIVFIAIFRAGGCYVPIDPELPQERQAFIANDSNAHFVVSSSDIPSISLFGSTALDISDQVELNSIRAQSHDDLDPIDPDSLAYLLYTSGTTGIPKGCLLTHRGLSEAIWSLAEKCANVPLEDHSKANYLAIASVAFDVHLAEVLVPLANRIPLLSAPRSYLLEDLPYYIKELRISHIGIVPSLIEATMGTVQDEEAAGHKSSLRYIASGGEKMSDAILDKWANHPTVKLANFYGPSEVTIGCAARFMNRVTPRANIGRPFANVSAYVVDENMNIILRGSAGELVVEGPLVGRGYHGRPDLTEKVFLQFPEKGKGRWAYRTGDLVRMMPDSTLEILGRIDTQIKLRGVRIESEGISSILRNAACADLSLDAVTVLAKHPQIGVDQLVSFIAWDGTVSIAIRKTAEPVPTDAPKGLLDRLRRACDKELASYMRPSHIIPLSWIPLNSNGKTDAKALTKLFIVMNIDALTRSSNSGASDPVEDVQHDVEVDTGRALPETEEKVMKVVEQYLKVSSGHLYLGTNLFEFGLDSMGAIQLAGNLKAAFGKVITAADVLNDHSVRAIANRIDSMSSNATLSQEFSSYVERFSEEWKATIAKVYPSNRIDKVLPPFPVQQGVLSHSTDESTLYVQHVLMRCRSETSVAGLRDAWQTVMKQQEVLRTVFYFGKDLVQVVIDPKDVFLPWVQKITDTLDDQLFRTSFTSGDALEIAANINQNVSKLPPFRLTLYVPASGDPFFVLSIHHSLFDGISLPILLSEVQREYLHHPQTNSVVSASGVLDYIASLDLNKAQQFWTQQFAGFDWRKTSIRSASSKEATVVTIPFRARLSTLQSKASAQQVSLQALLMLAYGYLLATRLYGEDDVVFGVIRAGRLLPIEGIESALFPMISVTPARIDFLNNSAILRAVQNFISASVESEHVPLSKIQQWVRGGQGLFETLFSVSFKERDESSIWNIIESQNPQPEYILAVEVVLDPQEDKLLVHAAYTTSDLSADIVEGIVKDLENIVVQLSDDDERERLLSLVSGSRTATPDTEELSYTSADEEEDVGPVDDEVISCLREVVRDFMRVDKSLSDDSSLLALGLDSIRSVGLSRAIRTCGYNISSIDIISHPTIRRMARIISQKQRPGDAQRKNQEGEARSLFEKERGLLREAIDLSVIKLAEDDRVEVYPTTVLQAGMLSQTASSNGERYVHMFPLRLDKTANLGQLREAWERSIQVFSILRTSFHFIPDLGTWAQVVHSASDLKWTEETVLPSSVSIQSWFHNFVSSMSWEEGEAFSRPPIYLHLMRSHESSDEGSLLVLVMHHALYDGLSVDKLLHIVQSIYHGHQIDSAVQFSELLPQLVWQEHSGTSFWLRRLQERRDVRPLTRRDNPSGISSYVASRRIDVDQGTFEELRRQVAVTHQVLGQAAFAKLLAILTKSRDVIFGQVVSGRNASGAEDVIGPILNTIPNRMRFKPKTNNRELLLSIHRANIDALAWQHASLRSIQRELGVSNLWDSLFVYQPMPTTSEDESLWHFDTAGEEEEAAIQYALNLELHESENGFVVKAACTSDLMNKEDFDAALLQYEQLLRGIISDPGQSCCEGLPVAVEPNSVGETHETATLTQSQNVDDHWREEYLPFRDLLSSISKIPSEHIHLGTELIAVGLDSITAIQLAGKARRIGVIVRAEDIIRSRTVADLLRKLKFRKGADPKSASSSANISVSADERSAITSRFNDATSIEEITVTSPGIKWLVGAWQKSQGSRFQHAFAYRMSVSTDSARLRNAWTKLVERHPILRSTIGCSSVLGDPRLVTFKALPAIVSSMWTEVTFTETENLDTKLVDTMKRLVSSPPSMNAAPTRAVYLRSPSSAHLVVYMNHFQYDAWSLQILINDLALLFNGDEPESSSNLAAWLRASVFSPSEVEEQRGYWKDTFPAAFEPKLFPALVKEPLLAGDELRRTIVMESSAILNASLLESRARELGVSLQSIFLASWAQVQSKYTSSDSATFGLWHAGRSGSFERIESLALPCMNVLPFHIVAMQGDRTEQIAQRVTEDLRKRTPAVEQTDLVQLDDWMGGRGKPLCNVFVNIVKVAPDVADESRQLLQPVNIPYFIPDIPNPKDETIEKLKITDLIQDDIMIDIVTLPSNTVAMSIEASKAIMNEEQAKNLIIQWAKIARDCLIQEEI